MVAQARVNKRDSSGSSRFFIGTTAYSPTSFNMSIAIAFQNLLVYYCVKFLWSWMLPSDTAKIKITGVAT